MVPSEVATEARTFALHTDPELFQMVFFLCSISLAVVIINNVLDDLLSTFLVNILAHRDRKNILDPHVGVLHVAVESSHPSADECLDTLNGPRAGHLLRRLPNMHAFMVIPVQPVFSVTIFQSVHNGAKNLEVLSRLCFIGGCFGWQAHPMSTGLSTSST